MTAVRITVPPSRHRVQLVIHPDRIESYILDIPDGQFTWPWMPCVHVEYLDDDGQPMLATLSPNDGSRP